MTIKQKARATKDFVKRNRTEIVGVTYIVGCFAVGWVVGRKLGNAINATIQNEVDHETLRMAVAAGHEFRFDPQSNLLWDVTINPTMKAG